MRNFARYWLVAHGVRELVGMLLRHESSLRYHHYERHVGASRLQQVIVEQRLIACDR